MSDKTLDLLSLRHKGSPARPEAAPGRGNAAAEVGTDEDECLAFGYLRGIRERALTIEFRFADGNRLAFPYSWLGTMKYNPSAGLLLKFVGDQVYLVLLEGSNLNAVVKDAVSLYDRGIQRHRVTWVRELPRQQVEAAREGDVTISRIRTLSYRPDVEPKDVEWLGPFQDQTA
jgi:hypothetical protein